jgi:chorismate mutase
MGRSLFFALIILLLSAVTTGCGEKAAEYKALTGPGGVTLGMTRMEVVQAMLDETRRLQMSGQASNPYASRYINNLRDEPLEVMYYYLRMKKPDDLVSEEELVPIILKDDIVVGWGWETLEEMVGGRPGP